MTKYNIWVLNLKTTGPTGPWSFVASITANDAADALRRASAVFGNATYTAYEGI